MWDERSQSTIAQIAQIIYIKDYYSKFRNVSWNMYSDENLSKAMDFVTPKVNNWIKDLFGGVEQLNLSRPQKELIQALTAETLLYNTLMPNEEIIAILSDIIRNIATRHSYGMLLDWGKRADVLKPTDK